MSAIEFKPTEREVYANPGCYYCHGTGSVYEGVSDISRGHPIYSECDCVKLAKANPIQLDDTTPPTA